MLGIKKLKRVSCGYFMLEVNLDIELKLLNFGGSMLLIDR